MAFKDNTLEFFDNKIVDTTINVEVMMDWEAPVMEKVAEYVCHNKGDILEIGFGMGISADYIQAQGVKSHTIIEIHPQILERLNVWASDKPNVTVIEGDWADLSLTDTYDGVFIDTFEDINVDESFKSFALNRIRSGGVITYWNNLPEENNFLEFDSISYEQITVNPDSNTYFEYNTYFMPKVSV